jgi:hypothetical protein
MKFRQGFNLVIGSAIISAATVSSNVYAQSAFAGFYGQVSTGYESNQLGSLSGTGKTTPNVNSDVYLTGPSQTFGGAPLVLGAGYYWQASDKWLLGVGVDYSALTQTSSNIPLNNTNYSGNTNISAGETVTGNGASMKLSNSFNLFVSPGYAIDKDKLVYLKAGYSQVTAQYNRVSSATRTANGVSTTAQALGGSQSSNQGGYLLGLGYKQAIVSGLYGFVEGNYMGYSAPSYTYTSGIKAIETLTRVNSSNTSTRAINVSFASLNTYQMLIGLGYAF